MKSRRRWRRDENVARYPRMRISPLGAHFCAVNSRRSPSWRAMRAPTPALSGTALALTNSNRTNPLADGGRSAGGRHELYQAFLELAVGAPYLAPAASSFETLMAREADTWARRCTAITCAATRRRSVSCAARSAGSGVACATWRVRTAARFASPVIAGSQQATP